MNVTLSPSVVTSRRRIKYRESAWRVHQFEVWSEELVCRAVALRMESSLLVWVGDGGQPQLTELAFGIPDVLECKGGALATALVGTDGWAVSLARRLTTLLSRPVFVSCGAAFDRFTGPIVERGIIAEIKSRPDCF